MGHVNAPDDASDCRSRDHELDPSPEIKNQIKPTKYLLLPMTSYKVIHDTIFMMLRYMYLPSITETTGAGVKKMKISGNPNK